jgi:hypothetical protein
MNGVVSRSRCVPLALMLALVTCCAGAAEEPPFLYGIGPIKLDLRHWTFTKQEIEGAFLDTVTHKQSGKRIVFVYLDTDITTIEDALATISKLIRGRNDLHVTANPKLEKGALVGGVLANYEVMKIERVAIVIKDHPRQATVYISSGDNPMEDADLLSIRKLADGTNLR